MSARQDRWVLPQDHSCYFYPARDCPGWTAGGTCSRVGRRIPEDDKAGETGDSTQS